MFTWTYLEKCTVIVAIYVCTQLSLLHVCFGQVLGVSQVRFPSIHFSRDLMLYDFKGSKIKSYLSRSFQIKPRGEPDQ